MMMGAGAGAGGGGAGAAGPKAVRLSRGLSRGGDRLRETDLVMAVVRSVVRSSGLRKLGPSYCDPRTGGFDT